MLGVRYFFLNVNNSADNSDKNDLLLSGRLHEEDSVTQDIHCRGSFVLPWPYFSLTDTVDKLLDSIEDEG